MANEIHVDYDSGNTLYAVIRDSDGKVWYVASQLFEDWGADGHDADDYDVALTDKSGDRYIGSFDTNVPAGRYSVQVFLQAGANPADGDSLIGSGQIRWNANAELTVDMVLSNKAVQNKVTGAIDYYDDDGQNVILTHTPTDAESEITRTPT